MARPPLGRMMHIHTAIHAGKFPNATTLARDLEVSVRSISRDIEFMRDRMSLPISYDEVRHGFFYSEEVAGFPSLTISEGELFALAVAEKALQQYRGTSFERPLISALKKVSESLPDAISLHLDDWNDSISFKTSAEAILDLSTFDKLAQATSRREQLELDYRKPGEKRPEKRMVDPYHLANVNGEWFLFAYDHMRKAIRTFVPARIVRIRSTGQKFEKNPKFSIRAELGNSFGVYSGTAKHLVVLRFHERVADYIREKKWHPSQTLRVLRGGELELRMTLSSLVEVGRWVLQWGGAARVLAPKPLVEQVERAAREILNVAKGSAVKKRGAAPRPRRGRQR
ncbi:MAG: helix-turn-helix transcriptional regulator [Limisphaerales bacterium]